MGIFSTNKTSFKTAIRHLWLIWY